MTKAPQAVQRIHDKFHPSEISIGIGVGRVATKLTRRVTIMDGPAFVNSRKAIDYAKKRELEVVVRSDREQLDVVINAIYMLIGAIKSRWTKTQWERINLYREQGTVESVADNLGVAKQSISKSLRNTHWTRVLAVEKDLPEIFETLSRASVGG